MKRAIPFLLIAAVALPAGALAKGKQPRRDVQGTIVSISETSVTVANRQGQQTYDITRQTSFASGGQQITRSSVAANAKVRVRGARDRRTAEKITILP